MSTQSPAARAYVWYRPLSPALRREGGPTDIQGRNRGGNTVQDRATSYTNHKNARRRRPGQAQRFSQKLATAGTHRETNALNHVRDTYQRLNSPDEGPPVERAVSEGGKMSNEDMMIETAISDAGDIRGEILW